MILANALHHIARTAARSGTSTRRLRWIEQRALFALRGDEYRDIDVDLPKDGGPNTLEKIERRLLAHSRALRQLADACERMDGSEPPDANQYQTALASALAVLSSKGRQQVAA